ncbi:MAG TPA: orotidine-5'-phosphate decarboxylase [Symbiobacteriaceae bacterium]|jgi:orotidine-5'-phosphate decarboxylase|nr:orotidine-5'-phosphate decarboxylase [Symbiobacteriaceae bacterium]
MPGTNFADRVVAAVKLKRSHVVVGLDPVLGKLPGFIVTDAASRHGKTAAGAAAALLAFNRLVIDAVAGQVALVKPQSAYYEVYGHHGMQAFWETCRYAREKGLLVIADAKRGDIGPTADAYAAAFFGHANPLETWEEPDQFADSVTVNPYLGSDGLLPFVGRCQARGTGVFVLVKTSNPSSGELQDQELFSGETVAQQVAKLVHYLGNRVVGESGYSSVGAVVGATYPEDLARYRQEMPQALILVPGYGAQGGTGADVVHAFNADGLGAVVNASRSIIFAHAKLGEGVTEAQVKQAIAEATQAMNQDINGALAAAGKLAW